MSERRQEATDESCREWIELVLAREEVCDAANRSRIVESLMQCIVGYRELERHRLAAPSLSEYRSRLKKVRASALRLARDLASVKWKNDGAAAIVSQADRSIEALRDATASKWVDHADCHSDLVIAIESVLTPLGVPVSKGGVFIEVCEIAWSACGLSGSPDGGIDRARERINRMESQAKT